MSLINSYIYSNNSNNNEFNFNNFNDVLEFVPKIQDKIYVQKIDNNKLLDTIKKFCQDINKDTFIVSLSGGIDSMVLITILKFLGYNCIGAHINYNNREETKKEQLFIEQWCHYNEIKLYIKTIDNIKRANSKRSDYEILTKKIRFDFYKEILEAEKLDFILLGHHKDDIVENIFANVCRGRYILDLAVIRNNSIINDITIYRPMIDYYKKTVYEFSELFQVPYFKDTTPDWSVRGKYRNKIYPAIEDAFTKNVKDNLIGLSNQSYEWNELVSKQIIEPFISKITWSEKKCTFNVEEYLDYPLCFWNIVFMKIFYRYGKSCPSRKGIKTFMNSIPSIGYASVSNSCLCKITNNKIELEFKITI